ncbi:hypothetical protein [Streptomyces sp. NBC_00059]|uniref:hypothetical protein n=1 Tax=Streptomyces sp. NBC_00059 TaxID=2975635 RepID=UPI00225208AD|nr:hypothetical protein [Streptomyces sp. NBC_00059]MCX5417684.1 hypothetical protein [Streptomyces sp. NBC_00059]MCX5417916.1 hypothetical protein [Streptomyces sp. NBC_00059]
MIIRIGQRDISAVAPLTEALGRPISDQEGLTDHTVVAHWGNLDVYTSFDEGQVWTTAEFAEHLDDPSWCHPDAVSPHGDRRTIWHADVRLHPHDRELTGPEWSEIAHRIARTAGIQRPGDDQGCRWIAVQAQPGRLHLLANLIRPDGTWTAQPHRLLALLAAESRRIETELDLISPLTGGPDPDSAARFARRATPLADVADATTQLAELLGQLADENTGPLSTVRGLVEHAAHRLGRLPHAQARGSAHQLELIASRLHGIQQDLDATVAALPTAPAAPARPTLPPYRAAAAPVRPGARLAR